MINSDDVFINGDGNTSGDFCFIDNTVQMNILAATSDDFAKYILYNVAVAVADRTILLELFIAIKSALK